MNRRILISVLIGFLLGGCVLSNPVPRNSRYKVDITSMEPYSYIHDSWVYRHPTKKATDYQKFLLAPCSVYSDPVKKIKDRVPYEALSRRLTEKLRIKMIHDYTLVAPPGEGVLRMEISVVDIKPMVKMKNGVTDTIKMGSEIKGSKLELDCYDSVSGEEIFAISTLYKGAEFEAYADPSLLPNIESAFDEWLEFLKERFDEAMAKKPTP